jgi:hypothetical protein
MVNVLGKGIGLLVAFIAGAVPAWADPAAGPRAELAIREVDLATGTRRYAVTIIVAGQSVEAGLDTGSTGLRILPRAMPAPDGERGGRVHYGYSSGIGLDGHVARVAIAFGALSGEVKVMRVEQVACDRPEAQCANAKIDVATFGIQGDGVPGQGFAAILGTNLKSDPVANPLEQLGVKRWIVELPRPGEGQPGRLILNPTDEEVADYIRLRFINDDSSQLDGCLVGTSASGKICAATIFDSGAPGIRAMGMQGTPWPSGTAAEIVLRDGAHQAQMPIVIGRRELGSGMFIQPGSEQRREPLLSLGIAPYFHWSVLYDAAEHRIGLRERK